MELRVKAVLLLLILCLSSVTYSVRAAEDAKAVDEKAKDEKFTEKLKEAEEAQEFGEDAPGPVESKIVKVAPEATLANGDGDIATTGYCATDIDSFCVSVQPGEGRLAKCLTSQQRQEEKGNVEGKKLSSDCKEELAKFKIDRATNINKDIPLAKSCVKDAEKFCADADPNEGSAVLACLREFKAKLSQKCQDEVFRAEEEAAEDYRLDADLYQFCKEDAKALCSDVKPGEGRIQDCLREKRLNTNWECQEELFRQEVENADDIRLSFRLVSKCMADKNKFCKDVPPGNARAKECLEDNRNKEGFSTECKEELEKMMERRAADFRLDAKLRETCKKDIEEVCQYEKDSMDSIEGFDARVIQCLQDYKEELTVPECKEQVHKLSARAAQDIRFHEPLAEQCFEDRKRLCDGVTPGSARVIRCLQDHREELSYECQAILFDQEVQMAEDIDFQYPMKRSCSAEIGKFCKGISNGHARVIRCLQEHQEEEDMSKECHEEVKRYENRSAQDYRLNYRLTKACQNDIDNVCSDVCSPYLEQACGGQVLRCLTDKQDELVSEECKSEVFYFEKMEVNDFRNDVLLAEACRNDVDKFCAKTPPGEGRVHACLREHREALSEECRKEELKLNIIQSRDIRLRPKLNKLCSEEIAVYCKGVQPGKGRVFKCLQENLAKPDFNDLCKQQIQDREGRMAEDYRLDYGVSSSCSKDIDNICADAKSKAHGHAEVLKCLVSHYRELADGCQNEMSRAVRMALWEYTNGAHLTGVCDADVDALCKTSQRNRGMYSIGAVGRCLSTQLAKDLPLQPECRTLVAVAAPKDANLFDEQMTVAALAKKVVALQQAAGIKTDLLNPNAKGASVITLTGWFALAAMAAIMVSVVGLSVFLYRRYTGVDRPYTIITKEGDV